MINVKFELYGALTSYTTKPFIAVKVQAGSSIKNAKEALIEAMSQITEHDQFKNIVKCSAIGNQVKLLSEQNIVDSDVTLAILPPVCGG